DSVEQAHAHHSFRNAVGLLLIRRASGPARGHGAEPTRACANVTQNHERSRAVLPALTHVGAAGAFANRVQLKRAHNALEVVIAPPAKKPYAQPVWARVWAGKRRSSEDARRIGEDVKWRGHGVVLFILRGCLAAHKRRTVQTIRGAPT